MNFYLVGAPGTGKRRLQDILQNPKQITNDHNNDLSIISNAKYQIIEETKISQIREQDGVILMYNLCNKQSFDLINNVVSMINNKSLSFVLLLGTFLDKEKQDRKITIQMGIDLKNKINAKFYEVSLKTQENIQEVVSRIVKAIQKQEKNRANSPQSKESMVQPKLNNSSLLLPENNLYKTNLAVCTQQIHDVDEIIQTILQRQTYVPARDNTTTIQCKINFETVQDLTTVTSPYFYGALVFFEIQSKQQFQHALQQLSALQQKRLQFLGLVGLLKSKQYQRVDTIEGIRNQTNIYGINFYAEILEMELGYIQYLRDQLKIRVLKGLKQLVDQGNDRAYLIQEKLKLQKIQELEKQDKDPKDSFFNQIKDNQYVQFICAIYGEKNTGKKTLISNLLQGRKSLKINDPKRKEVQFKLKLCLESQLQQNEYPIVKIYCYNITNEASFKQVEEQVNYFDSNASRKIIVGCFKDVQGREVQEMQGRRLRDNIKGLFYEVSNRDPKSESFQVFRRAIQSASLTQAKTLDHERTVRRYASFLSIQDVGVEDDEPIYPQSTQSGPESGKNISTKSPVFQVGRDTLARLRELNAQNIVATPEPELAVPNAISTPKNVLPQSNNSTSQISNNKNQSTVYNNDNWQENGQRKNKQINPENLILYAYQSRIMQMFAPQLIKNAYNQDKLSLESLLDAEAMQQRIKQLQPTKGLIKAQRDKRDAKEKSKKMSLTKNLPYNRHNKQEEQNKEIIILEIEIGDQLISLPIYRHSNAYQLAKQFAEDYGLSKQHLSQITAIILEKIEQYNQQHAEQVLEQRRAQHQTRQFNVPTSIKKLNSTKFHNKPLFEFELKVGNKTQLIAYRQGDSIDKLAESFITLTQIDREQYYDYVYSQIQKCYALYQMRQDGLASEL